MCSLSGSSSCRPDSGVGIHLQTGMVNTVDERVLHANFWTGG